MDKDREARIKKLALAYGTGWEYMPESEEAGSVLTDIFLEMADANRRRFGRIWEKQELALLQAVPYNREEPGEGRGALLVKAPGEENGSWLEEGAWIYLPREDGEELSFRTLCPVRLTSARLRCAVYRRGLWAWLACEGEQGGQEPLALFQPVGEELAHPAFRWYFQGLCDGREEFCFALEPGGGAAPCAPLPGSWTVSDGEHTCAADWQQTSEGCFLRGKSPVFAKNLGGVAYEVRLALSPGEEPTEEWLEVLSGDMTLTGEALEREPELCLTVTGAGGGGRVLPFGDSLEEAASVYLACDSAAAAGGQELALCFRESFVVEEKAPEPMPPEYQKLYKKYPWLAREQPMLPWQAQETRWEYFNGSIWRSLPGSEDLGACCMPEGGERLYRWKRPGDMQPCAVEGETHFYIRLRLVRVSNAYAACYRKRIPIWEEIRFQTGKRGFSPVRSELPDVGSAREEKMYLGFDREVPPGSCWYMGGDYCVFTQEQVKGKAQLFGRSAFWVELTEKRVETLPCLLPNYVPIRRESGGQEAGEQAGFRIKKGTDFYVKPRDMGILEAVCLEDICWGSTEPSAGQEKLPAGHYFSHFRRLLTPLDLELLIQEKYPLLQVSSCVLEGQSRTLRVELALKAAGGHAREELQISELQSQLPELREWLEELAAKKAPLWLQGCRVEVKL